MSKPGWLEETKLTFIKTEIANPVNTLMAINKAIQMVLDGFPVEKLSNKGEVVTVIDRMPVAVAQLAKAQLAVLQYLDSQMTEAAPTNGCNLVILVGNDVSSNGNASVDN